MIVIGVVVQKKGTSSLIMEVFKNIQSQVMQLLDQSQDKMEALQSLVIVPRFLVAMLNQDSETQAYQVIKQVQPTRNMD